MFCHQPASMAFAARMIYVELHWHFSKVCLLSMLALYFFVLNTVMGIHTATTWTLWKWGHFDRAKPTLILLLASWTSYSIQNKFRSFNAENLGSVGQRAAKWPTIKLWEWFDPGTTRIRVEGACTHFGHKGRKVCKSKVWWSVTLQSFVLHTPNFQH